MSKLRDEERASLREKTRNMTAREKVEFIWEYYKQYFIVALILIVLGSVVLRDMYINNLEASYVHVGVVESCAMDTQFYLDRLIQKEVWGEPLVYRPFVSASDASGNGVVQLTASLSAQEMDLIICDSNSLYFLLEAGISPDTDLVVPLLDTELEKNLGGKDLCLIVLNGQERSEKAQKLAELMLKQNGAAKKSVG